MAKFYSGFRLQPWRYTAQVALATVSLFLVLWFEQALAGAETARAVLVGAIASTAFMLFVAPHRPSAESKRVIGGHAWALVMAGVVNGLFFLFNGEWTTHVPMLFALQASLTVGLALLAMAITNTEHAPAAGTALAIVGNGLEGQLVIFVLTSVLMLVAIHRLTRKWLINLY